MANSTATDGGLAYSHLCDLVYEPSTPSVIPNTPVGTRMNFPVTGGRVEGPKLNGRILPEGIDCALRKADGTLELNVHATLETDDGALIYMTYGGVLAMSADCWTRFEAGGRVARKELYFRVTPRFETGAEQYLWLNNAVCVGSGLGLPPELRYRFHHIL